MAGTYYKYAERQADSQVNWFEIGKDLTDMLKKETETREAKKKAIDEASRQYGQELENAPQGMSDDVNKWTTDFAGDMQQYRLLTDRLLKSGQMKLKDYTLIRQNSLDGTKNLFNLTKEYQEEFKTKTERRQNDESSVAETQVMAMVEGFANLAQTKALINPTTGAINVGKMVTGPDGVRVLAEGPDNYMTVNQLRQRIKEKINKYDLNTNLEGETKLLGDVVTEVVTKTGSSTETGFITKITDPTKRVGLSQEGKQAVDAYMKTEQQIVDAQLSNPFNTSSVLMDWTGGIDPKTKKPYQVTLDPGVAKSSSHYILFGYKNGIFQPDFETNPNGKAQQEEAATYVRNKFRSMLEQKKEVQAFSQPRKEYAPEYVYGRGDKGKNERTAGNMIAMLYSGTPAQQQAAATYFGGLPNVRSIKRDDKGIIVTTTDGMTKPIPFINPATNELMTQDDFVRSASSLLIGKDVDINQVLKGALGTGTKQFKSGTAGVEAETNNPNEMYANYVSNGIGAVSQDEENAVTELAPILSKIGFTVSSPYDPTGEYIVIRNKDGVASEKIDLKEGDPSEAIKSFLLGNVPGKSEEERIMFLSGLAKKGVIKPAAKGTQQTQSTQNTTLQGGNVR